MEKITSYLIQSTVHKSEVRVWAEDLLLPTYEVGAEEKNPIFLEKRVYQGSSGAVYPYPVVEKISDRKVEKLYRVLFLENEYIKIMILPQLGGRVHMAYDKVKQRHFVYYNQVVKPALVGLTGPWISGGIEFNWPQHHRPSTYLPTDYTIEENADGSKTVWCNELERMFRTKGMQGFTLYPGKAYLEIKVKVYNRTAFPQTFLWWANPAVVVNDHYHSVFPPDVNAVFDHGKRDVSSFPIARGVYYKHDYSAGVDISKYKNIPVPTSYMAIESKYDFVGGYETDTQAGLLHIADHHVSPGKKQWTWGNGDFGCAWDRNLTDEDGPYIELMTGMYTDNQPDFSWLQPYEEKSWVQYFMPYSCVGYVKNATKDLVLNLEVVRSEGTVILYASGVNHDLRVRVTNTKSGQILLDQRLYIDPAVPFRATFDVGTARQADLRVEVCSQQGNLLLAYQPEELQDKPMPEPAKAAKEPKMIDSIEQLYLTGLHLEQYRHATYDPMEYYLEALRREPGNVRCNNAVGLRLLRKGQFAQAEPYFRTAVATLTERNPNPQEGEPYYNLGWCCALQEKFDEAYAAFFKSAWNAAWQDAAYFSLAQIDTRRGNYAAALEKVDRSLVRNWHNHKARQLKASLLRKLGRNGEALAFIDESLRIDPFNMGCRFERYKVDGRSQTLSELKNLMRGWAHSYLEYSMDFAAAGLYQEAIALLQELTAENPAAYPMAYYALGHFHASIGETDRALNYYRLGEEQDHSYCFPNRIEEVAILERAIKLHDRSAKAAYALGNFWYAARQYPEAIGCWERSAEIDPTFATVWRNLSLAYYNKQNNPSKALDALWKAYELDVTDARVLMELDQLYKRLGHPHLDRLALLEEHLDQTSQRDDLSIERITLYNQLGRYAQAEALMAERTFHPWEGGEGKITGQYLLCYTELAKQAIDEQRYADALALLAKTEAYPHHLGEGKLTNAEENDVWYYKGLAHRAMGDRTQAEICFERATKGSAVPQQAFFYNDPQPDKIFYQGLAHRALGRQEQACQCFNRLIEHGEEHLADVCKIDYFAVSLPDLAIWDDDLQKRNRIHCLYVMGLGALGLNNSDRAIECFDELLRLDPNHQGGQIHRNLCHRPC